MQAFLTFVFSFESQNSGPVFPVIKKEQDLHVFMNNENSYNFQVPSTSTAPSPIPTEIKEEDIKEESSDTEFDEYDENDSDFNPSPSGRHSVSSSVSTTNASVSSNGKRKRGRPAKPLMKLAPASHTLSKRERIEYERRRNNEASRVSRRNKRNQELENEEYCRQLEEEQERLLRVEARLETKKALINKLTWAFAMR